MQPATLEILRHCLYFHTLLVVFCYEVMNEMVYSKFGCSHVMHGYKNKNRKKRARKVSYYDED